jgi:hypothetical protein
MKRLLGEPGALADGVAAPGALLPPLAEPALGEPTPGKPSPVFADGSWSNEVEDSALRGLTPPAPEDDPLSPRECAESLEVSGECEAIE